MAKYMPGSNVNINVIWRMVRESGVDVSDVSKLFLDDNYLVYEYYAVLECLKVKHLYRLRPGTTGPRGDYCGHYAAAAFSAVRNVLSDVPFGIWVTPGHAQNWFVAYDRRRYDIRLWCYEPQALRPAQGMRVPKAGEKVDYIVV